MRSETAQTYFLEYQAAYGTADTDTGKIRVDVRAPENPPVNPVAVPDTVTLFGQAGSSSTCWPTTSTRPAACCRSSAPSR